MLAGMQSQFGIDVGYSKDVAVGKSQHGEYGVDILRDGDLTVIGNDIEMPISRRKTSWEQHIRNSIGLARTLTHRQEIAAAIINDSFFNPDTDIQFLLSITAVEALCEQHRADEPVIQLIGQLLGSVAKADISDSQRKMLTEHLNRAKNESLGAAIRTKLIRLLSQDAASQFKKLYDLRSKFVHEGKHRGDLGKQANQARTLAIELLIADIRQR